MCSLKVDQVARGGESRETAAGRSFTGNWRCSNWRARSCVGVAKDHLFTLIQQHNRHARRVGSVAPASALAACMSFCLLACGCGFKDNFDPKMLRNTASLGCFASAPVVMVGTITQVDRVGRPRTARKGGTLLDPIRITVSVENVLRGTIERPTIEIFGFRYSRDQSSFPGNPFHPRPGQRRLFLLRRESGRLRLYVDDVREGYAPVVCSGRHPAVDARLAGDPGRAIAWILLTPGDGYDEREFGFNVTWYAWIAIAVTQDKPHVFSLLNAFKEAPDEHLRREAGGIQEAIESHFKDGRWIDATPPCPAQAH